MFRGRLSALSIGAVTTCIATGWWYRPLADPKTDRIGPRREGTFISPRNITDYASVARPLLYRISSQMVILLQVSISRAYFYATGRLAIKKDDNGNYDYFVESVTNRGKDVPLITVSNHRSVADDPLIMSCILPYHLNIQPRYLRYGLCSQEYCFNPKFPTVIGAYIGLGHVLPIWRGGGINQKLLLDFARLAAQGEWCHIFPEAGVWQMDTLGGRGCVQNRNKDNPSLDEEGIDKSSTDITANRSIPSSGKLKWGVGKLIAHAPRRPIVIPFFHSGMEKVYPHDPENNKVMHGLPRQGQDVIVRFGKPICFDDLIQEHEEEHGPLWHYSATPEEREKGESKGAQAVPSWLAKWRSHPAELRLYSKIALRIETALRNLNEESNCDLDRDLEGI